MQLWSRGLKSMLHRRDAKFRVLRSRGILPRCPSSAEPRHFAAAGLNKRLLKMGLYPKHPTFALTTLESHCQLYPKHPILERSGVFRIQPSLLGDAARKCCRPCSANPRHSAALARIKRQNAESPLVLLIVWRNSFG